MLACIIAAVAVAIVGFEAGASTRACGGIFNQIHLFESEEWQWA
jgi:hypothetical protein